MLSGEPLVPEIRKVSPDDPARSRPDLPCGPLVLALIIRNLEPVATGRMGRTKLAPDSNEGATCHPARPCTATGLGGLALRLCSGLNSRRQHTGASPRAGCKLCGVSAPGLVWCLIVGPDPAEITDTLVRRGPGSVFPLVNRGE